MGYTATNNNGLPQPSLFYAIFYTLLLTITILIVVFFTVILPTDDNGGYLNFSWKWDSDNDGQDQWHTLNWHPILMVFSFAVCFPQAAVAYKIFPFSHNQNKAIHAVLQSIAMALSTTAVINVFTFKSASGYDNLYTVHSWIGFAAYLCFAAQYLFGMVFYTNQFLPLHIKKRFMPFHIFFGFSIFFLTCMAISTGVADREMIAYFPQGPNAQYFTLNFIAYLVALLAGCVFWVHRPNSARGEEEEERLIQ